MARRAVLGVREAFRDAPLQPAAHCNPLQPTATGSPLELIAKVGIGRDRQEHVGVGEADGEDVQMHTLWAAQTIRCVRHTHAQEGSGKQVC